MGDPLDYWELSEKWRSQLTREDVEKFVDYELMKNGVVKVMPPVLQPIAEVDRKPIIKYRPARHSSDDTHPCFDTVEQAHAYLALRPYVRGYDYSAGDKHYYFDLPASDISVYPADGFHREDFDALGAAFKTNKAAKDYNDSQQKEYKKAQEKTSDTLSTLWKDYFDCIEAANKHQRILRTRKEYIVTAGGNKETAERFLQKAFKPDEIAAADEWDALPGVEADLPF